MKLYKIVIGLVALVGISTPATASPWGGEGWGHGPKSVAEIEKRAAQTFAKLDTDNSGSISEEEFTAAEFPGRRHMRGRHGPPRHIAHHIAQEGTDTLHGELADKMFEAADKDGDGMLSRDEARTIRQNRHEVMRKFRFARMDSNGDSVLTPDEFPRFGAHAREMDTNGDGELSRDEIHGAMTEHATKQNAG